MGGEERGGQFSNWRESENKRKMGGTEEMVLLGAWGDPSGVITSHLGNQGSFLGS